jgi:citrate lyase subunit beta / citryl-CoA lyase
MPATARPRRSVLYMPGANARALEKARGLACDAIIMDLEDAVAPDAKDQARAQITAALAEGGYGGREVVVRANGLGTPWGREDLAALAGAGADAILLPKVESADGVRQALAVLDEAGAPETLAVWCMMETPRAILEAAAIAGASPRLAALVMGTSDLAEDLHAAHTAMRLPMLTALSHCILAARAYGLAILDGVYLDLADDEGFAAQCRQGAELGFNGKTLIHPKTIAAANAAFAPSEDAVAWARRIIAAHAEAEAAGKGVVLVDGKLIENLHVAAAGRTVALAEQIAASEATA